VENRAKLRKYIFVTTIINQLEIENRRVLQMRNGEWAQLKEPDVRSHIVRVMSNTKRNMNNVNPGNNPGSTKRTKKKCPHCGKHVFHKAADCYELEANASKRWTGWKSVKETEEMTK